MAITNVLMAGVGGQGIIVAGEALAFAAMSVGMEVKKSDVHGMSQRGGSVTSHVRFGNRVYSPLIPDGEADVLFASERLEAMRHLPFVKPGGKLVVNSQMIPPPTVTSGAVPYPIDILDKLRAFDPDLVAFDCLAEAKRIGNAKTSTVVLLGALSMRLEFDLAVWEKALEAAVPAKALDVNVKAFMAGRKIAGGTE